MKHSVFLKATIVATVLIAPTVPLSASEVAKETMTKSKPTVGEKYVVDNSCNTRDFMGIRTG